MTTPDSNLPPKNYITTGINKSLLTPCRRVGLSRLKKTPKNIKQEISVVQKDIKSNIVDQKITSGKLDNLNYGYKENESTPVHCQKAENLIKREPADIDITPQKESDKKHVKTFKKRMNKSKKEDLFHLDITKDVTKKLNIEKSPEVIQKLVSLRQDELNNVKGVKQEIISDKLDHLHCTPKQNAYNESTPIPFQRAENLIQQECNDLDITPKKESDLKENTKKSKTILDKSKQYRSEDLDEYFDVDKTKVVNSPEVNEEQDHNGLKELNNSRVIEESDSPPVPPKMSQVTVQVHHSTARKNINFNDSMIQMSQQSNSTKEIVSQNKENSIKIKEVTLSFNLLDKNPEEDSGTSAAPNFIKSRKRKLRLDSDDFESAESQHLEEEGKIYKSKANSTKPETKSEEKDLRFDQKLAKFTTEDYLDEFSKNPKSFLENLEVTSSSSTIDDNDLDDFEDFRPNIKMKIRKLKNYDNKTVDKNYTAIICALPESNDTTQRCLKHLTTQTEKGPKKNLTVSLERIASKAIKESKKINSKNEKKTHLTKLTFDDGDDEMFTSSPETDKKQRENLLELLLDLENELKQKEETLEKLKQAQVYKKKHSPEKLKLSSERWKEGCQMGLKDLLQKMQEVGPMNMDTLIKKLRIPVHVIEMLKI